jgi:hypothetical protein
MPRLDQGGVLLVKRYAGLLDIYIGSVDSALVSALPPNIPTACFKQRLY